MDSDRRSVHLVGSIPGDDAATVMRGAAQRLGGRLRMLPDGETGERRNWIVHIIESLRNHPDLEIVRQGDWSDYKQATRLKVRRGHRLHGDTMDFGHVASFEVAFPLFEQVREETGQPELVFMVGIPGDLDMALFALGPIAAFRNRKAFADATVNEITAIHRQAGSAVVFQIEIPAELVFVARMPRPLRPAMAAFLARGVVALALRSPEGARFGLHLCLGDLGNKALGRMRDTGPLVELSNALLRRWPAGRPLEYLHVPLAAGDEPAPVDEAFYRPLAELKLPADVRFVAGFVHEDTTPDQHRQILQTVERQLGRRVDVATSCGLGRRTPEQADATIDGAAELVDTAP